MGVGHGPSRILLRAAARPADHFGSEIFKASGWHPVVGFIDRRVRVQARIGHDPVDKIVYHHSDAVYSTEAVIEAGLRLLV
jgi:hypothetical protein